MLHMAGLDDVFSAKFIIKNCYNDLSGILSQSLFGPATGGQVKIVKTLIEHGANVNATNNVGDMPLHVAAWNGHVEVAKILVQYSADVTAKDNKGSTALHFAADSGHLNFIEFLIEHGANVNAKDNVGWTPLNISAWKGRLNITKYLIEHGAKINTKGNNGYTAIAVAAIYGNVDVTKYLIEHGADINVKGDNGFTPYDIARTNDHAEVAKILMEHGAKDSSTKSSTKDNNGLVYIIVGVVALIFVSAISITCLYVRTRRRNEVIRKQNAIELKCFEHGNVEGISSKLTLEEQADLLPYDKKYEFPRDKLKLGAQLSGGAFGIVYEGIAHGILPNEKETKVAVKMVKRMSNDEILRALILELKIMVHLGQHLNLVNLLGAVTTNITRYDMMIIVEYCRYGCLQNILIKSRSSFVDQIDRETGTIILNTNAGEQQNVANESHQAGQYSVTNSLYIRNFNDKYHCSVINSLYIPYSNDRDRPADGPSCKPSGVTDSESIPQIATIDLFCWSFQISRGMYYLASRKVLHGDLAARNVLLSDYNVIKICDFGLARSLYKTDVYRKKKEALLPFKWLALESIEDLVFSIHTDVWAFGIVLWELFSLGMTPYPGLSSGQDLYQKLLDGYRMEKPKYATQDIYDIMLACWRKVPESRPSFDELEIKLSKFLDTNVANQYIKLNEPYLKANVEKYEGGKTDFISLMGTPDFKAPSAPSGIALECNAIVEIHQQSDESSL
ncbi:platelet-derived growth factor receptor alpha-like [Sitodiplosis mosellana]|uniref:platelet-derived growth factor receptor alpha-like n=1 Tax=Sitodiplosis mosellana TaxID=263140 RepID=UPI0024437D99|nr:platelet-derived growth factor receptor alpha-like [Sitodiplosis mosellana]